MSITFLISILDGLVWKKFVKKKYIEYIDFKKLKDFKELINL